MGLFRRLIASRPLGRPGSHGFLLVLLLSEVLVLLIPISMGAVVYARTSRVIAEDVSLAELALLQEIKREVESGIARVRQMSRQVSVKPLVRRFMDKPDAFEPGDQMDAVALKRELVPYLADNPLMHDFYLYFKASRRSISPSSTYDPYTLFEYVYPVQASPWQVWQRYLDEFDGYFAVLPCRTIQGIDYRGDVLIVIQAIPVDRITHARALLVALLDAGHIRALLTRMARSGYAALLDGEARVLIETGQRPKGFEARSDAGIGFRGGLVVTTAVSEALGFRFVSAVPAGVFAARLHGVRNLTLGAAALCLIGGLAVAYALARRNYRPIAGMVESLSAAYGRRPDPRRGEMEFIQQEVAAAFRRNRQLQRRHEDMIRENRRFREQANRNSALVKNALLTRLIRAPGDDRQATLDWLVHYGVSFPHGIWQVILVHIEEGTRLLREDSRGEWSLVRFIVGSLTNEMAGRRFVGEVCELDYDLLALVLNIPGTCKPEEAAGDVADLASRVQHFMRDHYRTELTVGMGATVDRIERLSESYGQARDALNYRILREESAVIRFDEITDRAKDYYYPIEAELRIISSVRAGNFAQCAALLDEIYDENVHRRKLSVKLARCLSFDMVSTALRVLDQVRVNYVDVFGEQFDPVEELMSSEHLVETCGKIKNLYRGVCEYLTTMHSRRHSVLRERMISYIHQHFLDESLTQTRMAEDLGITAPYLSSLFKQATGTSMVDYIGRLRVDQAKLLLAEGSQTLSEIAAAVGCGTDKTLIRLFKRFEGVTPGRFRETRLPGPRLEREA